MVELGGQLGIAGFLDELQGCEEILGALDEAAPELDLGSKAVGLTEDSLGGALVIPEARDSRLRLELGDAPFLDV